MFVQLRELPLKFYTNLDGKKIDPKRAEKRNAKIFVGGLKSDFNDEEVQAGVVECGEIELYDR